MYENKELCEKCGGACCHRVAGCNMPEDFNNDIYKVAMALKSGRYTIDCWEGDPRDNVPEEEQLNRAYFIRPAGKGLEGQIPDYTWGGIGCTFLTDNGCSLSEDERPSGCRLLEPKEDGCKVHGSDKQKAAIAWIDYKLAHLLTQREITIFLNGIKK